MFQISLLFFFFGLKHRDVNCTVSEVEVIFMCYFSIYFIH